MQRSAIVARRRRPQRPFLLQPLPLATALIALVSGIVGFWPSSKHQSTKLIGEVEKPSAPALKPLSSPVTPIAAVVDAPTREKPATPAPAPAPIPTTPEPIVQVKPAAPVATETTIVRPIVPETPQAVNDFQAGLAAKTHNDLLQARDLLNHSLHAGLQSNQVETARQALADIANQTIFSPSTVKGDPLVESHQIAAGETLNKLAKQYNISEDLLAEVNRLKDKHFIRQGMRIKILKGPFHATITKSDHLLHIFLGECYVRSYRVALGAEGKTPTGKWRVINHQTNPGWTDPHTGKRYHPDDPNNPIGEYWIGLEGTEGAAVGAFGYGIHGTNEPQTIGQDVSLGCVRLAPDDIAYVYKLLLPGASLVTITD